MDAKKFLQDKGIYLKEGLFTKKGSLIIGSNKDENWDLIGLLEEYALLKAHDIMLMKNK